MAAAPAIIISTASSQVEMPPMPTTGMDTRLYTSRTIRTATGNTAGPDSPPVLLRKIGRRVRMSMRIPVRVLISDTASAPASSTAAAMSPMFVTFGVSFTISGLRQCARTALVTAAALSHEVPNPTPPCFTLGQEMFISTISTSVSFNRSAMAQ